MSEHMDAWLERDLHHKNAIRINEKLIEQLAEERDALRAKLDETEAAAKEMVGVLETMLEDEPEDAGQRVLMETVLGVVGSYRLWREGGES